MTRSPALSQDAHLIGWRAVAREMIEGARDAISRFPVTALALLALAVNANLLIADFKDFWSGRDDLVLPLFAAATASLAGSLVFEARHAGSMLRNLAALLASLAAFAIGWWGDWSALEPLSYVAALCVLMLIAPALGGRSADAFWLFMVRFAFAVLVSLLALCLFAGGMSAILASLTYLFGVDVPPRAYGHVWAVTGLFAAPLFGLGRIPADLDAEPGLDARKFMVLGMKALGDYVAAPLILVYAAVLHAYALKIVLTGDVPHGQIGWLVLAFGLCVFAALIVIHPFLSAARAPTRLLLRLWPVILPAPLALLAYAMWLRIGDYGLTPMRYLLGLFGLTMAIVVILQIPKSRRGDIRVLAVLPTIALLLASFGPQGAVETSIRSQKARFLEAVSVKPIDQAGNAAALAALRFLRDHDAVARVAPETVSMVDERGERKRASTLFAEVADAYGLERDHPYGPTTGIFHKFLNQPTAVSVEGFDTVIPMLRIGNRPTPSSTVKLPGGRNLSFEIRHGTVLVTSGTETLELGFDEDALRALAASSAAVPDPIELSDGKHKLL
ncbi:MAG TPA: DUF4153 domain-containing protein, partial [Sinorhizobium sp.]|nr:DUF4153 domain-containing protein [Sinorhizobium sp.]